MSKKENITEPVHLLKQMFINGFKRGWDFREECYKNVAEISDLEYELQNELDDIADSFNSKEAFFKFVLGL